MQIINASQWASKNAHHVSHYFVGQHLDSPSQCALSYRPFAWLEFNHQTNELSAARDHFGQEPFYYYYDEQRFIFGSNIPDIVRHLPSLPALSKHCERDIFGMRAEEEDPPYSTETYYQGIFRLTPAHTLRISNHRKTETAFWSLDPHVASLNYARDEDYLEHFSMLMDEALRCLIPKGTQLAAEFSGGFDSSAIFVACRKADLSPTLFTHPPPASSGISDEDLNVHHILNHFSWHDKHFFVDASHFDPLSVFKYFSQVFAGCPPYWQSLLATNIYERVVQQGYTTILSGFAGDDCVSLRCPPYLSYYQYRREHGLSSLLREWSCDAGKRRQGLPRLKLFLRLLQYMHPKVFSTITPLTQYFGLSGDQARFYHSLRDYEFAVLQGDICHDIRMKVEYNAVLAKSFGFSFVYPMLYPPLIEFCFRLPLHKKKQKSVMGCLIQDYLSSHIPGLKPETKGGAFVPSTMQKCRDDAAQGKFSEHFSHLPFQDKINAHPPSDFKLMLEVRAFMLKCYFSTQTKAVQP